MDKANINAMIYNMANPFYIFSVQYFINSFFIINLNIYRWWWYWKQVKVTAFDVWWWVEVQKVCLMNENMILWFDIKDDIIFEVWFFAITICTINISAIYVSYHLIRQLFQFWLVNIRQKIYLRFPPKYINLEKGGIVIGLLLPSRHVNFIWTHVSLQRRNGW